VQCAGAAAGRFYFARGPQERHTASGTLLHGQRPIAPQGRATSSCGAILFQTSCYFDFREEFDCVAFISFSAIRPIMIILLNHFAVRFFLVISFLFDAKAYSIRQWSMVNQNYLQIQADLHNFTQLSPFRPDSDFSQAAPDSDSSPALPDSDLTWTRERSDSLHLCCMLYCRLF
jgi:hypothetical protein